MNIVEILNTLGYIVIRYNHDRQIYLVKKIPLRAKREGLKRNLDIKLKVKEIDFDSDGDLYVTFIDLKTNKVCDTYWHRNMSDERIYDVDFDTLGDDRDKESKSIQGDHDEWLTTNNSIFRIN